MFSVVLRPKVSPSGLNLLPLYAAVAIAEAVEQTTGVSVECKWPNDILVGKRKVAGVLIEGSVKQNVVEYVVIGIGINVNQKRFVGELKTKATSLSLETGTEIDRAELFRSVLSALERHYNTIRAQGFNSIIPLWLSRTAMINKPISVSQQGTIITGVVKGLSDDGGLVLQSNGTVRTLFAGDVTIVGM
jgi:BirA family biotin operon repressor/biotin-[acetyl-CoA-carboxylase] ligase